MKYLVQVSYTNPSHEHVSLRRRVDTVNRIVEAANEEQAILRVSRQQQALGFLIKEAKIVNEAEREAGYKMPAHVAAAQKKFDDETKKQEKKPVQAGTMAALKKEETKKWTEMSHEEKWKDARAEKDPVKKNAKLGALAMGGGRRSAADPKKFTQKDGQWVRVEQVDEQSPAEIKAKYYHDQFDKVKPVKAYDKDGKLVGHYRSMAHAKQMKPGHTYKEVKEEIEQVDEANMRFDPEAAARPKSSDVKNFLNRDTNRRAGAASKKYIRRMTKLGGLGPNQTKKDTEAHMKAHFEEVQYIEEKLSAADPASKWISDFVASDNPKFAGKSKKERINMALGAYYAAKREKNEAVEKTYNEKEVNSAEKKQEKKKGNINKISLTPELNSQIGVK